MPRMGVVEREETKILILVCRARGYNHKQILSVVNDNLTKKSNEYLTDDQIINKSSK